MSTSAKATAKPKKRQGQATAVEPEKITHLTPSPSNIKEIGGSGYFVWDMAMIDRVAMTSSAFMVNGEDLTKKMAAIALRSFEPTDAVEGMLASQAVALHYASLECSRRAMLPQQNGDIASKLRKDAANSARAMVEMCEALDRRRGKGGQQRIVVERVQVAPGGQAIVGAVTTGTPLQAPSPAPQIITHGAPPMETLDAEPVAVRQGEGEHDARSVG